MSRREILRCAVCGKTVEVLESGNGSPPICCGQEMQVMPEQTAEFKFEKHVPYPEAMPGGGIRVTVGKEMEHPMTGVHHIEWIEVIDGDVVVRKFLNPGESPNREFDLPLRPGIVVREFCNLHGLWKFEVE